MGTRYSQRLENGTSEHYDSQEEMAAAQQARFNDNIQMWFALGGLLIGGLIAYSFTQAVIPDWPKFIRFSLVVASAIGLAVLLARIAIVVFNVAMTILGFAILFGIGSLIWKAF